MYNKRTKRRLDRRTPKLSISQLNSAITSAQRNTVTQNSLIGVLGHLNRRTLTAQEGRIVWFKLSSVGSSPMTGRKQTCKAGTFSEASGAVNTSIYIYPQIALSHYEIDDIIASVYVSNCWVSLYNQPVAFDECT